MLGSLFGREERAVQATTWGTWPGDEGGATWAGVNVDAKTSLQLLAVYGSVRLITDSIATLPLDVLRERNDGTREQIATPSWLEEPVAGLHRVAWLTQILTSLLLDGNAYIAVLAVEGRIVELVPLAASAVTVKRENGRRVYDVHGQRAPWRILHIPALMLAGSEVGLSPVEYARQSIGGGVAVQEFAARFFGQGAVMSGVIESQNEMTPDKARDYARQWARKHSGKDKAHLPGVLQGGDTWKATGVTNEQAQFLQTRAFSAAEIAGQMFLLDPSDLGIPMQGGSQAITYGNLEQRNARRVQVALMPWIVRIEAALSSLLAKPRYVKLNVGALLRGDTKSRFEAYKIGIESQFMVPNQAREFEDWPPLPGGDQVVEQQEPAPPEEGDDAADQ